MVLRGGGHDSRPICNDFSGTIQLVRNTEAAKCEVDDSHGERGQSMLGARLSFVSIFCCF